MKDSEELIKKLGFVSCKYLLETLGINSMDLHKMKSYGIIKSHKNHRGNVRGYYTYDSFKRVKEFMEGYKGYFGHPASLKACVMALEKKEGKIK